MTMRGAQPPSAAAGAPSAGGGGAWPWASAAWLPRRRGGLGVTTSGSAGGGGPASSTAALMCGHASVSTNSSSLATDHPMMSPPQMNACSPVSASPMMNLATSTWQMSQMG